MGLGLNGGGVGSAAFFAKQGAHVTVTDLKTADVLEPSIELLKDLPIRYVLGKHNLEDFLKTDLIIKNPDVRRDDQYIAKAQQQNIPVEMEESLFLKLSPAKVIGITGTRGKSTTSRLVFEVLKSNNLPVFLGGNMKGSRTLELLPELNSNSWVVLELSSWQLSAFTQSPHISLVTNIYPDHLNRYASMDEYINDKKNIFRFQKKDDYLVLNSENETTKGFANETTSQVIFFQKHNWLAEWKLKIPGEHNRSNAAAVWKLAQLLYLDNHVSKKTIQNFTGLEYRIQKVAEVNGISFINDSTSTTPTATIMAINSFPKQPIVLLLGGNDKNLPLEEMLKIVKEKVDYVVLLKGSGTDKLLKLIENDQFLLKKISPVFSNYEEAINEAYRHGKKGGVVLLSPGFTSFAMFNNEFERADLFNVYAQKFQSKN